MRPSKQPENDKERAFSLCESLAQALSASRQAVFKSFKSDVLTLIKELGMPNATLHIEREEEPFQSQGKTKSRLSSLPTKALLPHSKLSPQVVNFQD